MKHEPDIAVVLAPEPFTPRLSKILAPVGKPLVAVLTDAINDGLLAFEDLDRVRVYVNGEPLADDAVCDFVPEVGDLINIAVEPLGSGDRGGNKALQTVLMIAVIAVSVWVTGGAATPGALDGLFFRAAAAATVQVAGTLAIQAAFKPEQDQLAAANDRRALQSATNQVRPRSPMPLVLGQQRVAFDMIAAPFTTTIDNDVWLTTMYGLHYGQCTLSDTKIGEIRLADYPAEDWQGEFFLEPGVRNSQLYPAKVQQENYTDELDTSAPGLWEIHTADGQANRIEVDLTWPSGLRFNKENGKILPQEVMGQIHYAVIGTEDWMPAPIPPAVDRNGNALSPGEFYVQGRTNDALRRTFGWDVLDPTQTYKVRVSAWDPDGDDPDLVVMDTYWTALRSITFGKPVIDETLAVVVLRIKSSDDLNGQLPNVTGVVTPVVPVWNGSDWSTTAATSNAAALARWLVTGPAAAKPLNPTQIDDSIVDCFDLIEQNDWKGSLEIKDDMSLEDALKRLGFMGRFRIYWNGSALCFVPDWERAAPRQMFTGRNVQGYRYRRLFPDDVHAVIVEFRGLENETSELIVYNDGYDASNAELFENYRLEYSASLNRAYREGRAFLAKRTLQVETHEWQAGYDSVLATLGDRVLVRHASSLFGEAEARVDSRIFAGGLVAGLRLDEFVTMEPGVDYAIDIRRPDGVIRGVPLANVPGRSRVITFATPLAQSAAAAPDDLIAFGRIEYTTEDLEIVDIDAGEPDVATIRALRYIGPELEQAETGPIPPLDGGNTPREQVPRPRIVGTQGSPAGVTVAFEIDFMRVDILAGVSFRMRRSARAGEQENSWIALPNIPPSARQGKTPPIDDAPASVDDEEAAYRVDIELRTLTRDGKTSAPSYAYNIPVSRFILIPQNVVAAGVIRVSPDGSSYSALYVAADRLEAGLVSDLEVEIMKVGTGTGEEDWRSAGPPLPSSNPNGDFRAVDGGQIYDVRVRWRTVDNYFSPWAYIDDVQIPYGGNVANDLAGGVLEDIEEAIAKGREAIAIARARAAEIDELAMTLMNESLRWTETESGLPLGAVVKSEVEERTKGDEYSIVRWNLLGVMNDDGSAFIFDQDTVLISPTESFAERFSQISTTLGENSASITEVSTSLSTLEGATAHTFQLLGAENGAGTAFVLNTGTVRVGPTTSFATYMTSVQSSLNGNTADIVELFEVTDGLEARYTLAVNVNGVATGFYVDGVEQAFRINAPRFSVSSATGGVSVVPFEIDGTTVKMINVVATEIEAGIVTADKIVGGAVSNIVADNAAPFQTITASDAVCFTLEDVESSGGKHLVTVSVRCNCPSGNNLGVVVTLKRGGLSIDDGVMWVSNNFSNEQTYQFFDTPGVGTFDYDVAVRYTAGSNTGGSVTKVSVTSTELRK